MIGFELRKLLYSRRPLHAALALVVFIVLMLIGFYTYAKNQSGSVEFRYTYENESYFNGLTFTIYAFYFAFLLVLPIFVATEGAVQIAGEADARTLPLLLARPVSKARILLAKLFVTMTYGVCLVLGLLVVCLGVGLWGVGWGDLDLYPGVLQMTDRHQHLPQAIALRRFGMAGLGAGLGLVAPISFAFLVSTWVRRPVNAAATAVALYLILHVISGVHLFEALRPWLFTSYLSFWRGFFQVEIPWGAVGQDAVRILAHSCLFLALALGRFRRREEG